MSYLKAQVVNTSSGKDNINSSIEDLLNAFLGDVRFALTNGVQLGRIGNQHLHIIENSNEFSLTEVK